MSCVLIVLSCIICAVLWRLAFALSKCSKVLTVLLEDLAKSYAGQFYQRLGVTAGGYAGQSGVGVIKLLSFFYPTNVNWLDGMVPTGTNFRFVGWECQQVGMHKKVGLEFQQDMQNMYKVGWEFQQVDKHNNMGWEFQVVDMQDKVGWEFQQLDNKVG